MLKAAEQEITYFLTKYFSVLFSSSQFPSEGTRAIIIPLHKKGDVNNPDNCRGISILSVVSKVYTHIINSRLTLWADNNFVLTDAQAGFRKGRSAIDRTIYLLCMQRSKNSLQIIQSYMWHLLISRKYTIL